MQPNQVLQDVAAAVPLMHERSMASPAFSADGVEQSGVLIQPLRLSKVFALPSDDADLQIAPFALEKTILAPVVTETSVPIEIWEGVVDEVYPDAIAVTLKAKMNLSIPPHAMEIDLAEVQPQDRDLVVPGAVFYLTMYRETTGRTVKNVQDIRFRREPNWTRNMVAKMERLAAELEF